MLGVYLRSLPPLPSIYVHIFNQIKKGLLLDSLYVFCIISFVTDYKYIWFFDIVKLTEVHLSEFSPPCFTQVIESYLRVWGDGSAVKFLLHKLEDLGLDSQHSHKKPGSVVPTQKGRVRGSL